LNRLSTNRRSKRPEGREGRYGLVREDPMENPTAGMLERAEEGG
jgi:hypothetical protein